MQEHFVKSEIRGQHNHDFFFFLVFVCRCVRFRRGASPPFPKSGRPGALPATAG